MLPTQRLKTYYCKLLITSILSGVTTYLLSSDGSNSSSDFQIFYEFRPLLSLTFLTENSQKAPATACRNESHLFRAFSDKFHLT